ncbi:GNAT family N-acetyltransferase [Pontibacter sp. E15-1]|uniref:GNAT family N-acetyltransferase n=1 Tax=Pontibacter sp. E15-1 TaxID=2919918 RepID=UPI001F4FAFD3|nr:GNAT family N-acetyltransferase [Pontibacter sp. E15-1]MCJ8167336.1 GNAT family N-acetyltransferase [Pontibacter sp. E15-1]
MNLTKVSKSFEALSPQELYELLRLRSDVFVVEQNCVFLDLDNKDQQCHHLLLYTPEKLVAYARLVPPGLSYPAAMSIGRILTSLEVRGTGIGKVLLDWAINACYQLYGQGPIKIGAQLYAKKFYESFGFEQSGEVYDEDGIDHIEMTKAAPTPTLSSI